METILSTLFWIVVSGIILFFIWQAAQEVLHHTGEPLMVIPITMSAMAVPVMPRMKSPLRRAREVVKVSKPTVPEGCPSGDEFNVYEVRFAGRWYACLPLEDFNSHMAKMSLRRVLLGDRRTHQRVIVRRVHEIRRTKG
ncbi:MAG: hypothetical protein Q8Q90_02960 [bacterium]|nr:hypothetical protein [bacterium]